MAILHAYFDESGKPGDHPVVTFTGVCVSQPGLANFDAAWNALLRQYELPFLHMAKAGRLKEKNGPKMPRHQSASDRVDALIPFADCINQHLEVGLIEALDVRGFNAMTVLAKKGIGSPDDPYYLAVARGLLEIVDYVDGDDKISLICDDDVQTAWGCYSHYRAIRRIHEKVREKIVSLSFANDKCFPALQAADMVAFLSRLEARLQFYGVRYELRRLFRHLVAEQPPPKMQWFKMFANEQQIKELGEFLGNLPKKQKR